MKFIPSAQEYKEEIEFCIDYGVAKNMDRLEFIKFDDDYPPAFLMTQKD